MRGKGRRQLTHKSKQFERPQAREGCVQTPSPLFKTKKNREVSLPDLFEGSGRREGQPGVESRFVSRREAGKQSLIWPKWVCA